MTAYSRLFCSMMVVSTSSSYNRICTCMGLGSEVRRILPK